MESGLLWHLLLEEKCTKSEQGCRENSDVPGQRRKTRPTASEASRKFAGSRIQLWKISAGLLYEIPQTLKHWVL